MTPPVQSDRGYAPLPREAPEMDTPERQGGGSEPQRAPDAGTSKEEKRKNDVHASEGPSLYATLEVESSATPDEIKRAYRKLALQHHPDKNAGDDTRFKEILHAYEILSDERKRTIYDQYGLTGVEMFARFGEDNPVADVIFNPTLLITAFCGASAVLALLIMFLAFIAVQTDGVVSWSWASVFVPIWIIDSVLVLGLFCILRMGAEDDEDDDDAGERNEDDAEQRRDGEDDRSRRQRRRKRAVSLLQSWVARAVAAVQLACFIAWQVLLVVRLSSGQPSWIEVWIPVYILEFLALLRILPLATLVLLGRLSSPSEAKDPMPWYKRLLIVTDLFRWWIPRVLLAVFIPMRADNIIGWNWALVAVPLFAGVFIVLVMDYVADADDIRTAPTNDDRQERRQQLVAKTIGLSIVLLLFFSFVGMLIVRLNETEPAPPTPTVAPSRSVAVILTPFFIVLSFFFCCCCCCLPCIVCARQPGLEEHDHEADEAAHLARNTPQLYIEARPAETAEP